MNKTLKKNEIDEIFEKYFYWNTATKSGYLIRDSKVNQLKSEIKKDREKLINEWLCQKLEWDNKIKKLVKEIETWKEDYQKLSDNSHRLLTERKEQITQLKFQLKQQRKKIKDRINAIRSKKCPSNEILSNAIISELEALLQAKIHNFTVKE